MSSSCGASSTPTLKIHDARLPAQRPRVAARVPHDRPTMIVADGVLEYLRKPRSAPCSVASPSTFHHGQIAFDVMNSFAVRSGQRNLKAAMEAVHRWAVDDTSRIDALDAKLHRDGRSGAVRLSLLRRLPWRLRLLFRAASRFVATGT